MPEMLFYDALREGLWISVEMSAPILGIALFAGILVGLFQALTSIQEMTLTFVPKLAAMVVVFWVSMGFMTSTLVGYFHTTVVPLVVGF